MTDSTLPPSSPNSESLPLRIRKRVRPKSDPPPRVVAAPPEGTMRQAFGRMRQSRLAMLGLVALAALALVSVFADLLASDLPLLCRVQGTTYVLPAVTRPAALAGLDNARLEASRAPGDWAIHPLVAFGPRQTDPGGDAAVLVPPLSASHPLGTDAYGRDVFARLVHGARTYTSSALLAVAGFVLIGALVGAFGGFFGGPFDALLARLIETLTAFPTLILVLVVQAVVPHPTTMTLLLALALTRWTEVARLVRAEVLLVASQDYVLAARALGASPWRVLFRHVAPNARAPVLVAAAFGVASVVLIEAALDFLRVGVPGSAASWGETLSQSREHLGAWWLLVFPGAALLLSVVALNLVGEALRDALDPRLHAEVGLHESLEHKGEGRPTTPPSSTAFDGTTHA
jgi:peptide/nickel transport system permease protein